MKLLRWAPLLLLASCKQSGFEIAPEVAVDRINQSIVACGNRIYIGAPVVLWSQSRGYDATAEGLYAEQPAVGVATPPPGTLRYEPGRMERDPVRGMERKLVEAEVGSLKDLEDELNLCVIHYGGFGFSRDGFQALHDRKGESVHFLVDLDGTIYQTLDLRDTALHVGDANGRSVAIELANVGAFAPDASGDRALERAYDSDEDGARVRYRGTATEAGLRIPGYVARPLRNAVQRGRINGQVVQQYDFTPAQYGSLVKLVAALCREFPKIEVGVPRDGSGRVLHESMAPDALAKFRGVCGHFHVDGDVLDPGPAFDWEVFLARLTARVGLPNPTE